MQYISSDTNVWIDFVTIQKTEIPFRLPYTYIMNKEAVENELLSPKGLGQELISYGLVPVGITIDVTIPFLELRTSRVTENPFCLRNKWTAISSV